MAQWPLDSYDYQGHIEHKMANLEELTANLLNNLLMPR